MKTFQTREVRNFAGTIIDEGTIDRLNEAPRVFYSSFMTCNSRRRVSRTDKIESNERQFTVEFDLPKSF